MDLPTSAPAASIRVAHSVAFLILLTGWSWLPGGTASPPALAAQIRVVADREVPTRGGGVGNALLALPEGDVLAVGYEYGSAPADAAGVVARLGPEGPPAWIRRYPGEEGEPTRLWDAVPGGDGFILVGFAGEAGAEDVLVIRTDAEGRPLAARRWGGEGRDRAWSAVSDGAGGAIVAAETTPPGSGATVGWVLRVGPGLDTLWTHTVGGEDGSASRARLFSVARSAEGEVVAVGGIGSDDRDGGDNDALVVRLGADGSRRWVRTSGHRRYDVAHGVAMDGAVAVVTGYGTPAGAEDGDTEIVTWAVDPSGRERWRTAFGAPGHERAMMAAPVGPRGGARGGARDGPAHIGVGFRESRGGTDVLLWALSEDGRVAWSGTLPREGADRGVMVLPRGPASFLVTGAFGGGTGARPSTFRVLTVERGDAPSR